MNGISIIIPAHKATKYIDECIASINKQTVTFDYEILVGIDGCKNTLEHMKKGVYENTCLFYFEECSGPYIVKNSLADEAKYDIILFFDADDVMADMTLIKVFRNVANVANVAYIKLNYLNFQDGRKPMGEMMSDAVIAIKKSVFNELNGFYGWKCAADTEFEHRLIYNRIPTKKLDSLCYYRRLHGQNLTLRNDTGHGSAIRTEYVKIIHENTRTGIWKNPEVKPKNKYYAINSNAS